MITINDHYVCHDCDACQVMSQSSSALQLRYLQVPQPRITKYNIPIFTIVIPMIIMVITLSITFSSQTLNSISAEKNSTVIFPLPLDLVQNIVE